MVPANSKDLILKEGLKIKVKIAAKKLSKDYRTRQGTIFALKDFSLDIVEGEFLSIVGPSGCGKTTFLNVAAGFIPPTGGEILMDNKPIQSPSAERAVVFQDNGLFPWMSARENIAYGLMMKGKGKNERALTSRTYLELVGLGEFADSYPKDLSEGMKKRVELARAFANEPAVILLDEPFANLDAQTRKKMHGVIQTLRETTLQTAVFVSHDVDEAILLSDRIAVMTPRPGNTKAVLEVPFARPRTSELYASPAFREMRQTVLDLLTLYQENEQPDEISA